MGFKAEIKQLPQDIDVLSKYFKQLKPKDVYVEIGTNEGGSALIGLIASDPEVEIHTIDPVNIYKLRFTRIKFYNDSSLNVAKTWDKPINLLFIDGAHHGDAPYNDFKAWEKFVVKGGYILFHDYGGGGVTKACERILKEYPYKLIFRPERKTTCIFQIQKI